VGAAALGVVSTVASAAVVSMEVALVVAVLTPLDLMAASFVARRFVGADFGPDSGKDFGPASSPEPAAWRFARRSEMGREPSCSVSRQTVAHGIVGRNSSTARTRHGSALFASESLPAALGPDLAAAIDLAKAVKAASTRKAYGTDFRLFREWCDARGVAALPAAPETVAAYLAAHAATSKASTLGRRVAAIRYAHKLAGLALPTDAEGVKATMRGIRRTYGSARVRRAPAVAGKILGMVATAPDKLEGLPFRRQYRLRLMPDGPGLTPVRSPVIPSGLVSSRPRRGRAHQSSR
jgi:Phage integrase, N-terminal SAM-like domain